MTQHIVGILKQKRRPQGILKMANRQMAQKKGLSKSDIYHSLSYVILLSQYLAEISTEVYCIIYKVGVYD